MGICDSCLDDTRAVFNRQGYTPEKSPTRCIKHRGNALHDAVEENNLANLQKYLSKGMDPNMGDENGWTPLNEAAEQGNVAMVEALLQARADPNLASPEGWTPLMPATEKGRVQVVPCLLRKGAHPDFQDRDGWTCIMEAAERKQIQILQQFVQVPNVNLNGTSSEGKTALMVACINGDLEIVKLLWHSGANHTKGKSQFVDMPQSIVAYMEPIVVAEKDLKAMLKGKDPWDVEKARQKLLLTSQIPCMEPTNAKARGRQLQEGGLAANPNSEARGSGPQTMVTAPKTRGLQQQTQQQTMPGLHQPMQQQTAYGAAGVPRAASGFE